MKTNLGRYLIRTTLNTQPHLNDVENILEKLNPEDWSRYWEGSTITTFQGLFENNYTKEIYEFWQKNITTNHKNILDVACGNGALSWIANDLLNREGGQAKITGIDFADINPFKRLGRDRKKYPNVSFIPNTPAEKIPFENQSIDLVVSQYGIEYSDLEKSIPEISRVLQPAGKVCLIMHTDDSALVNTEKNMLAACKTILEEDKLHEKYLELDTLYRTTPDNKTPDTYRIKNEIHHTTYKIRRNIAPFKIRVDIENYLYRMEKVFSENTPRRSKKRQQEIFIAVNDLRTYASRLSDLISAAQTPEKIEHLAELFDRNHLHISEKSPIYIDKKFLYGLSVVAEKRQ